MPINQDHSISFYCQTIGQFLQDSINGVCLNTLISSIPPEEMDNRASEIRSWKDNILELAELLSSKRLSEAYIALELSVPLSKKRIDCAIFGKSTDGQFKMTVIELKRWSNENVHWANDVCNYEITNDLFDTVVTRIDGHDRFLVHPCVQCRTYVDRLRNTSQAVIDGTIDINGLAYCFNFRDESGNILSDKRYSSDIKEVPIFYSGGREELQEILYSRFSEGCGETCYRVFIEKGYGESPRFWESARSMLEDTNSFLHAFAPNSDQAIAEKGIVASVKQMLKNPNKKQVFIINGGPGTGKTIVGMRLLCTFLELNSRTNFRFYPMYMIRSTAVRKYLEDKLDINFCRQYITSGSFSRNFFRGNNSNRIIFYDECHRLGEEDNPVSAVNNLLDNYEIIVFLMDEQQCIAGKSSSPKDYIKEASKDRHDVVMYPEYTLNEQMRCKSSDDYIHWIESLVYNNNSFDLNKSVDYYFHICDTAKELLEKIDHKTDEGHSARICAGYCWPWHSSLRDSRRGVFYDDIIIGNDVRIPWNTHTKITPPEGYVSKEKWAFRNEGIRQAGCIYTTQGIEFDYIGVIVGNDLYYDPQKNWIATNPTPHEMPSNAADREPNSDYDTLFNRSNANLKDLFIRNIYRVLLTRGIKGCFVYFCDTNLKDYVKKQMPVFSNSE